MATETAYFNSTRLELINDEGSPGPPQGLERSAFAGLLSFQHVIYTQPTAQMDYIPTAF